MQPQSSPAAPPIVGKLVWSLALPYGFVLAALYLLAFWGKLGLNPFHYGSPAELLAAALASLVLFAASLLLGMVVGMWLAQISPEIDRKVLQWLRWVLLLGAIGIAGGWVWLLLNGNPLHWLLIGLFLNFGAVAALTRSAWFRTWQPSVVAVVAILLAYVPCAVIYYGTNQIARLSNPLTGHQVDQVRSELGTKFGDQLLYVGALGDSHVLFQPSRRGVILMPRSNRIVYILPPRPIEDRRSK